MPTRRYLALPLLALALVGARLAAFAQTAAPPAPTAPSAPYAAARPNGQGAGAPATSQHRRRGNRMQRALGGLALSPAQRGKIRGYMHAFRAARNAGTPQPRAQLLAQIEGVLTPDERSKFERRMHHAHRHPANAGMPQQAPQQAPPAP